MPWRCWLPALVQLLFAGCVGAQLSSVPGTSAGLAASPQLAGLLPEVAVPPELEAALGLQPAAALPGGQPLQSPFLPSLAAAPGAYGVPGGQPALSLQPAQSLPSLPSLPSLQPFAPMQPIQPVLGFDGPNSPLLLLPGNNSAALGLELDGSAGPTPVTLSAGQLPPIGSWMAIAPGAEQSAKLAPAPAPPDATAVVAAAGNSDEASSSEKKDDSNQTENSTEASAAEVNDSKSDSKAAENATEEEQSKEEGEEKDEADEEKDEKKEKGAKGEEKQDAEKDTAKKKKAEAKGEEAGQKDEKQAKDEKEEGEKGNATDEAKDSNASADTANASAGGESAEKPAAEPTRADTFKVDANASGSNASNASAADAQTPPAEKVVPPPKAGSLLDRVRGKMQSTHSKLATLTQEIMSVGQVIDKTEEALLGKVLDVESAKGLILKRTAIDAANARSEHELMHLHEQIDSLNSLLGKAQKQYLEEGERQKKEEMEMMAKLEAHSKALASEQATVSGMQLLQDKLLLSRQRLERNLSKDASAQVNVTAALGVMETSLQQVKLAEGVMRSHLIAIHDYGWQCHERAKQLHVDVGALAKIKPKHSAAAASAERQAEQTQMANLQRLRAESAMLQAEIQRVEGFSANGMDHLKKELKQISDVELNIIKEVRDMGHRMAASKEKTVMMEQSSKANFVATVELQGRKKIQAKELGEWQEKVNPVVFAAVEAENDALELELEQALQILTQAKTEETSAYSFVEQMHAAKAAQEQAVATAQKAREMAVQEGRLQVQAAIEASKVHKGDSQKLFEQAWRIIAARCKATWDERDATKGAELQQCRQNKQELTVVMAQKATLEQTLQAAETAASAEAF
eukprot:TRINITY_DN23286_c0_g1_i1.p1 TRINITY_DN23286_c0_g1~~TRINITY_DN23286_c0_g1_i1.p1  ORF type:complete len:860 (+),score=298.55 TRINITY_DN23286_c0_g1_i1:118-2697(+)